MALGNNVRRPDWCDEPVTLRLGLSDTGAVNHPSAYVVFVSLTTSAVRICFCRYFFAWRSWSHDSVLNILYPHALYQSQKKGCSRAEKTTLEPNPRKTSPRKHLGFIDLLYETELLVFFS